MRGKQKMTAYVTRLILLSCLFEGLEGIVSVFSRTPENQAAMVGTSVTFWCETDHTLIVWNEKREGQRDYKQIAFKKNVNHVDHPERYEVPNLKAGLYGITIKSVVSDDVGAYRMKTAEKPETRLFGLAVLTTEPTCTTNDQSGIEVDEGTPREITCQAGYSGSWRPEQKLRRKKSGMMMKVTADIQEDIFQTGLMKIKWTVKYDDADRTEGLEVVTFFNPPPAGFLQADDSQHTGAINAPSYEHVWKAPTVNVRFTAECASSPCVNGGTCTDQMGSYLCVCVKGYMGDTCETEGVDPNASPGPFYDDDDDVTTDAPDDDIFDVAARSAATKLASSMTTGQIILVVCGIIYSL